MQKFFVTTLFVIASIVCNAQLTLSADTAFYNGFNKAKFDYCYSIIWIKNTDLVNPINCTWQKTNENFLTGWSGSALTADNIDYPYQSTPNTITLAPGDSSYFTVFMKTLPTSLDGCSDITLTLTSIGLPAPKNIVFQYCTWPTSVNEIESDEMAIVYPNPFQENIHIQTNFHSIHSIQLFNLMGQLIEEFKQISSANNIELNPSIELAPGNYLIKFLDQDNHVIGKSKLIKR